MPGIEEVQHSESYGLVFGPKGPKFAQEAFWGIGVRWRAKNSALGGKAQGLWGCLSSLWRQQRRLTGEAPPVSAGSIKRLLDVFGFCWLVPFLLFGAAHLAGQRHGCRQDGLAPAEGLLKFLFRVDQKSFLSAN